MQSSGAGFVSENLYFSKFAFQTLKTLLGTIFASVYISVEWSEWLFNGTEIGNRMLLIGQALIISIPAIIRLGRKSPEHKHIHYRSDFLKNKCHLSISLGLL